MSETVQQPATKTPQSLRDLFDHYRRFVKRLGEDADRDDPEQGRCYDFEEFVAWWSSLDLDLQQLCERDFRKGYEVVIAEGEEQVAAVVAKYKQGECLVASAAAEKV
jgi:hypothetical protein